MAELLSKIGTTLEKLTGEGEERPLLVGISGGPDSVALAHALKMLGRKIFLAHFNHQLRETADRDEYYVGGFASKLGVKVLIGSKNVSQFAKSNSLSIEEAARELRYQYLFEQAKANDVCAVVVGHNANDQAETLLLNLIRGSGLDGLRGMQTRTMTIWDNAIPLLRPMLGIWRSEIEVYCQENNLDPRLDESNDSLEYSRNYLRHQVIPRLEEINPAFQKNLIRSASVIQAERDVLESIVEKVWQRVIDNETTGSLSITIDEYRQLEKGIRYRLLRKVIKLYSRDRHDLSFGHIEEMDRAILLPPKSGRIVFRDNVFFQHEGRQMRVSSSDLAEVTGDAPQMKKVEIVIQTDGRYEIGDGWIVAIESVPINNYKNKPWITNKDNNLIFLDASRCKFPLTLRPRLRGERFEPFGMGGQSMKISDYMINEKLPRRLRAKWPLLSSGEKVVWIPGYQMADWAKVTTRSTHLIKVELTKS